MSCIRRAYLARIQAVVNELDYQPSATARALSSGQTRTLGLVFHRRLVKRKWDYTARREPGRPPTVAAVKKLIMLMAKDNPTWGHRRIHRCQGTGKATW